MNEPRTKFLLDEARVVAKELYDRLLPFCERCKVVGSVRRKRSYVSDVELLFIPKRTPDPSSFMGALLGESSEIDMIDMADLTINRLVKDGVLAKRHNEKGSPCWGPLNKLAIHTASGMPVDFFATTAENWPVSLVIRTGGKRTNLQLTMGANKLGLTLNAYGSGFTRLKDGVKIPCHSEEDVFRLAGVPFKEPRYRV